MDSVPAIRSFFLQILFLGVATAFCPAVDWPPITPEEQAMTDVPQQPGAPAVILRREEVGDDLNNYHSTYLRIKILNEAGRKYADVELPYNRRNYTIEQVSGRTLHTDGTAVPFEGKPFDKVVIKAHGIRYHVKAFTLPDVQVGSILDLRYNLRYGDNMVLPPEWIVQDELFQKKATFKFIPFQGKGNVEIELAHHQLANHVSWSTFLPKGAMPQEHSAPRAAYVSNQATDWVDLNLSDVPAFIEEPFMPPPEMLKWRVKFYYQVSSKAEDYWRDQGKFWNKDVENFLGRKKGIAEAVAATVAANDTQEQKVRKIYNFVGSLENQSYRPYRPQQEERALGLKANEGVEDVLRQKSGDHDDLNRLFVAMVREAGIPAWLTWVAGRDQKIFEATYMSTSQLDAEVAIAEINGKDAFLDPGTKFCPYGMMDWRYTSTRGLRQREGKGAELADTPLSEYQSAKTVRVAKVKLTEDGRMEGTVAVAFYGLEAMNRRREGGRTDSEGQRKLLEEEIKSWLPGGAEVTLTKIPVWQETESPLVAEFRVSSPLAASAGKRWMIPPHLFQVNEKPMFSAANRVNAVYFYYPWAEIDEVHIALPPNASLESLPPDEEVRQEYALYRVQQKQEVPNTIFSRRDVVVGGNVFPNTLYKDVKGFFDKAKAGDDQPALLKAIPHGEGN